MLKASKHEATFKIRNRLRPVRDDHVIGIRCKHSNVLSRDVLISRFLLGNLTITMHAFFKKKAMHTRKGTKLCPVIWN